jgi:hypothetical protein
MTMTLYIDRAGTLTNGATHSGDLLQVIRALLELSSMLLRERLTPPAPSHAPRSSTAEDEEITWHDAEWQ